MNSRLSSNSQNMDVDNQEVVNSSSTSDIYLSYEDLPNAYSELKDYSQLFSELKSKANDKEDWKTQFDVLESLRILNKYNSSIFGKSLNDYTTFIQKSMNSIRSNLSKNGLLLVKEIFGQFKETNPPAEFLAVIVPSVLERGISDKGFIKAEARGALKVLEKNALNDSIVVILCERSFDKNFNIGELSFGTLSEIVAQGKENLDERLSKEAVKVLFETISKAINGKRAVMKKAAEGMCQLLKGAFDNGQQNFEGFLKESLKLKDSDASVIVSASQEKKSVKPKADFSAFLKEQKANKETGKDNKEFAIEE